VHRKYPLINLYGWYFRKIMIVAIESEIRNVFFSKSGLLVGRISLNSVFNIQQWSTEKQSISFPTQRSLDQRYIGKHVECVCTDFLIVCSIDLQVTCGQSVRLSTRSDIYYRVCPGSLSSDAAVQKSNSR
jgi:hypothetical protein